MCIIVMSASLLSVSWTRRSHVVVGWNFPAWSLNSNTHNDNT